jgi:hypothetical protein
MLKISKIKLCRICFNLSFLNISLCDQQEEAPLTIIFLAHDKSKSAFNPNSKQFGTGGLQIQHPNKLN